MLKGNIFTSPMTNDPSAQLTVCRINNLSVASRVHIIEPQWNPSVEDQAIGRVLRLGQEKKVCVIRYVMSRTIEEVSQKIPRLDHGQQSNSMPTKSVRGRQLGKIKLALAGGLQSSKTTNSSDDQRTIGLQELSKIIESTVFTEALAAIPQAESDALPMEED